MRFQEIPRGIIKRDFRVLKQKHSLHLCKIGKELLPFYPLSIKKRITALLQKERRPMFLHNLNTSSPDISNMDYVGKISSISVDHNKNSMAITLANMLQDDELSVRFNDKIISAENEKFAVLVDSIEKISRPEFTKQFPDYMNELFCMHCVLQVSMGRDFDENYGPINYYLSERTSLTTLTFPVEDNVVFVTANKNISPITLARKIINIIDAHRRQSSRL